MCVNECELCSLESRKGRWAIVVVFYGALKGEREREKRKKRERGVGERECERETERRS